MQHICSWWFLLAFVSSEAAKKLCGRGLQTLNWPFPDLSFLFLGVCVCACSWTCAGQFVFCVPGAAWSECTQNHSSVLRYFIPALNLSVRHSRVLGWNTCLIKVWGDIRRNNDRVQQLYIREILWKNSECGSYVHPCEQGHCCRCPFLDTGWEVMSFSSVFGNRRFISGSSFNYLNYQSMVYVEDWT